MLEIPICVDEISTILILYDSQATLAIAYNDIYNGKSRHISLRHEYVRQLICGGIISISYVKRSENLADPFTKEWD